MALLSPKAKKEITLGVGAILLGGGLLGKSLEYAWGGHSSFFSNMIAVGLLLLALHFVLRVYYGGGGNNPPPPAGPGQGSAPQGQPPARQQGPGKMRLAAANAGNKAGRILSTTWKAVRQAANWVAGWLMEGAGRCVKVAETNPKETVLVLLAVVTLLSLCGWLLAGQKGWSYALAVVALIDICAGLSYWNGWQDAKKHWQEWWIGLSLVYFLFAVVAGWSALAIAALGFSVFLAAMSVFGGWKALGKLYHGKHGLGWIEFSVAVLCFGLAYLGMLAEQSHLIKPHKSVYFGMMYLPDGLVLLCGAGALATFLLVVYLMYRPGAKFVRLVTR